MASDEQNLQVRTTGGRLFWSVVKHKGSRVLQQHRIGPPLYTGPPFRIILYPERICIATASTLERGLDMLEHPDVVIRKKITSNEEDDARPALCTHPSPSADLDLEMTVKPASSQQEALDTSISEILPESAFHNEPRGPSRENDEDDDEDEEVESPSGADCFDRSLSVEEDALHRVPEHAIAEEGEFTPACESDDRLSEFATEDRELPSDERSDQSEKDMTTELDEEVGHAQSTGVDASSAGPTAEGIADPRDAPLLTSSGGDDGASSKLDSTTESTATDHPARPVTAPPAAQRLHDQADTETPQPPTRGRPPRALGLDPELDAYKDLIGKITKELDQVEHLQNIRPSLRRQPMISKLLELSLQCLESAASLINPVPPCAMQTTPDSPGGGNGPRKKRPRSISAPYIAKEQSNTMVSPRSLNDGAPVTSKTIKEDTSDGNRFRLAEFYRMRNSAVRTPGEVKPARSIRPSSMKEDDERTPLDALERSVRIVNTTRKKYRAVAKRIEELGVARDSACVRPWTDDQWSGVYYIALVDPVWRKKDHPWVKTLVRGQKAEKISQHVTKQLSTQDHPFGMSVSRYALQFSRTFSSESTAAKFCTESKREFDRMVERIHKFISAFLQRIDSPAIGAARKELRIDDASCVVLDRVHEAVLVAIFPSLQPLYYRRFLERDAAVDGKLQELRRRDIQLSDLGARNALKIEEEGDAFALCISQLTSFASEGNPSLKIKILVALSETLCSLVDVAVYVTCSDRGTVFDKRNSGSEDLLILILYAIIRSNVLGMFSQIRLLVDFMPESLAMGEEGYGLATLETAVNIMSVDNWAVDLLKKPIKEAPERKSRRTRFWAKLSGTDPG